jgi:hypothetical protein
MLAAVLLAAPLLHRNFQGGNIQHCSDACDLQADGPWVHSITITGHSLGGALASICGFDLATKIAEATGAREEDDSKNDPELVRFVIAAAVAAAVAAAAAAAAALSVQHTE